VKTPLFGVLVA